MQTLIGNGENPFQRVSFFAEIYQKIYDKSREYDKVYNNIREDMYKNRKIDKYIVR